ncbi:MAG TPA: N-6 DNA methylase [bacterium]|nr:N-6 DNA methylase [bacterium]HQL62959.1 N-6 DNA methylase [bacterium]
MANPQSTIRNRKVAFGDFQTPLELAHEVCRLLKHIGIKPRSFVEPACGTGNFLLAAADAFPHARGIGLEINSEYVSLANSRTAATNLQNRIEIHEGNFFTEDWERRIRNLPAPVLILGNPPWVTNSQQGQIGTVNLPKKSNFPGLAGLEALTGKSNFDISEWMLLRLLEAAQGTNATVAMLCKTAVARKVLLYAAKRSLSIGRPRIYRIDAQRHFGAVVDAGLFFFETGTRSQSVDCGVFSSLTETQSAQSIGIRDGFAIADLEAYNRSKHMIGKSPIPWRSGIKHDCAKILELQKENGIYRNGLNETVELEETFLYPLLKGADLANGRTGEIRRWLLVPQCQVGEDTRHIESIAPLTWNYLQQRREYFDERRSSIYRNQSPFAIFGVGPYSFAPWKVAVSALYKNRLFQAVGPHFDRPVMLDDTCYFYPCRHEQEARDLAAILNSPEATDYFQAFIFPEAKRPITATLLNHLDLGKLTLSR